MNNITLAGEVSSITVSGEKVEFVMAVKRLSDTIDYINCSSGIHIMNDVMNGEKITCYGEVRTANYKGDDEKSHLKVYVHVNIIAPYEGEDKNNVTVQGFLCKEANYRFTPYNREICDLIIASNRNSQGSDYIPCIAWSKHAKRMSRLYVGEGVNITGRLQSREYEKRYEHGVVEIKTAYEISITKFSKWGGNRENVG